jgi:hypothetical protein
VDYDFIAARESIAQTGIAMGDLQASHIAIYLTMIFAYISVAYIAGKKLTRFQLGLTSFIFTAAAIREVLTIAILARGANQKYTQLAEMGNKVTDLIVDYSILYPIAIWSSGLFVALLFMWSVRHPKTE